MVINNYKNTIFISLGIIILFFIIILWQYTPVIFQEGNPWPQIKGIAKLNFGNTHIIKLSSYDNKYITKNKNGLEALINFLKNQGYQYIDQMGSGYFFKNDNLDILIVTRRQYSRFYSIWNIAKNDNNIKYNINN